MGNLRKMEEKSLYEQINEIARDARVLENKRKGVEKAGLKVTGQLQDPKGPEGQYQELLVDKKYEDNRAIQEVVDGGRVQDLTNRLIIARPGFFVRKRKREAYNSDVEELKSLNPSVSTLIRYHPLSGENILPGAVYSGVGGKLGGVALVAVIDYLIPGEELDSASSEAFSFLIGGFAAFASGIINSNKISTKKRITEMLQSAQETDEKLGR